MDNDLGRLRWDGTLSDTLGIWMSSVTKAFDDVGLHPTAHEIGAGFGDSDAICRLGIEPKQVNEFWERALVHVGEQLSTAPLYPGAVDLLQRLRAAGAMMGVAGDPVQVRNHDGAGVRTTQGPFLRSDLPIAGFAVIEAIAPRGPRNSFPQRRAR